MPLDHKPLLRSLLFCLYLAITGYAARAQGYHYTHYDTKDGLAGATAYGIAQDRKGFIWIGTETGLSRFDGRNFRNFTVADGLPSNEIFGIFADSRNRIWLISFINQVCYYQDGKIHNQQNDPLLKKLTLRLPPDCIAENAEGEILITNAVESYVVGGQGTTPLIRDSTANGVSVSRTFNAVRGTGSLAAFFLDMPPAVRGALKHNFMVNIPAGARSPVTGTSYYIGCPSTFQTGHLHTITRVSGKGESVREIALPPGTNSVIPVDGRHHAFLRSHNGLSLFDVDKGACTADMLTRYNVLYVFRDTEGNRWFSTKGAGIFKLSAIPVKSYSLDNLGVRAIFPSGKNIFIGTDDDLLWSMPAIDSASYAIDGGQQPLSITRTLGSLSRQHRHLLISSSSSNFLAHSGGFVQSSLKSVQMAGDTALVATSKNAFILHIPSQQPVKVLYSGRTTCGYMDDKHYYIGTLNGLIELDKNGERRKDMPALLQEKVNQLGGDGHGALWIATAGRGLIGYREGEVFAVIGEQEGLSSNTCTSLFVNGDTIWAGTDKGLNRVALENGGYRVTDRFTTNDGLRANMINTVFSDGHYVYTGNPLGMDVFDALHSPRHGRCDIVITGVEVSGRSMDPTADQQVLDRYNNYVKFDFSGLSFLSGNNLKYRYRLSGLREEWDTTVENFLNYPSLPSGNYVFQVCAINKFGDKSEVASYAFSVSPLLWERSWFRVLLVLLSMLTTAIIVRLAIRRSHRKETAALAITRKLLELEQMALRAQMNPHFIFNCLNSMQQYILNQDVKNANHYLSRFAGLVRQTLDNAARINITLKEEISYLKNYIELERLQLSETFRYDITVADGINLEETNIPNMVLQPYVENAIKHGVSQLKQGGYISIAFSRPAPGLLTCVIEDNGPGIGQHAPLTDNTRTAHGMSITDKRIRTLNQLNGGPGQITVLIENKSRDRMPANGTRVTVSF